MAAVAARISSRAIFTAAPARSGLMKASMPLLRKVPARGFTVSSRFNEITKRYTQDHEWISVDLTASEPIGTIGITEYAQSALGDVVYVELPSTETDVSQNDAIGAVESVKSASDILSPVSGTIVEVNDALADKSSFINKSAEEQGWIAKIRLSDVGELDALMDQTAYDAFTTSDSE
ncbi:glycine cleavage system H-protein subunit [Rhizina undulata]